MFDQLTVDAPDRQGCYILTLAAFEPSWPPGARFRRVDAERMLRIVQWQLHEGEPYAVERLLRFLGIREHRLNVSSAELVQMVGQRLERSPRLSMFERLREPAPRIATRARERPAAREASSTPDETAYVHVETVSETGSAVSGVRCEIELPDGSTRIAHTDAHGSLLIENVQPGTCRVVVTDRGIDNWEPDGGGSKRAGPRKPEVRHVVKQGECLSKIARSYGVDDWKLVWEHGSNAGLREKRKSPHVLRPGDILVVPGAELGEISCPTDTTQRLLIKKLLAPVAVLNAHLLDDVANLTTEWESGEGTLASAVELHKDESSRALRTRDVPHGADLVLMVTG